MTRLKDVIQLVVSDGEPIAKENRHKHPTLRLDLKAGFTASQVDDLMRTLITETKNPDERLSLMAQTIVEPIMQIVPYAEMYNIFFMEQNYGDLEDNAIPIEDTVAMAWETHDTDGGTLFVRVGGLTWTRPTFQTWDYGIEVPWNANRFVGWNFLSRQMLRCAEALARKRDNIAHYALDVAITAQTLHFPTVAGGVFTKASADAVIKAAQAVGFPATRALINTGTFTDMATWLPSTTLAQYPQAVGQEILTTLRISNYGGIEWFANPYASTTHVYFGGMPNQIGWHQTRGSMKTVSDVDIINNRDLHKVMDSEHAWYIGNGLSLRRFTILS